MNAVSLHAQRVQFPTPAQPVQATSPYLPPPSPYGAPAAVPTYSAPAPAPNYALPATSPPTLANPYSVAPSVPAYAPPAVGPPPTFDPYAVGGTVTPPPAAPYPYTPQAVAPYGAPATPSPAPMQPAPNPYQYQPAPYDVTTSGETYWAKTQRLLQELSIEYTYLYGKHSDPNDFEVSRAEVSTTFAFPMFYNIETPLLVTPGFAFNWFEGPLSGPPIPGPPVMAGGPDLPPQVYDAYLDLAWYPRYSPAIGAELGFRTGVYSDFDFVDSDSLRFMGRGAADIAIAPDMDVVLGAVYLDRVDIKILPVVGIYYRPTPDWDIYAVFPNPKIRRFMANVGTTKWWWYAAGEYGGGSWTVARQTTNDRIDYNDIRVIGGLEWETQTQIRGHVEVGYVFDREIIFTSGDPPSFTPDNTIMLRAGIDF